MTGEASLEAASEWLVEFVPCGVDEGSGAWFGVAAEDGAIAVAPCRHLLGEDARLLPPASPISMRPMQMWNHVVIAFLLI